uniref:Uncharacterized protein n=1 Tax=Anguilla anguilla TaxID=7936 RepID=A0A0E9P784_ANGAN
MYLHLKSTSSTIPIEFRPKHLYQTSPILLPVMTVALI